MVPSEHSKWALRCLKARNFCPCRSLNLAFAPDEEIGGHDDAEKLAESEIFRRMNVGMVLDEGLASHDDHYRVFDGEEVDDIDCHDPLLAMTGAQTMSSLV